jgi:hypothetical protein
MPKKVAKVSSKYAELYEDWLDYLLTGFNILVCLIRLIALYHLLRYGDEAQKSRLLKSFASRICHPKLLFKCTAMLQARQSNPFCKKLLPASDLESNCLFR